MLILRSALVWALLGATVPWSRAQSEPPAPGFFEPDQPFFHTLVELPSSDPGQAGEVVVRGVLLPVGADQFVLFDQELLRVAAVWQAPKGQPGITPMTMAQISYESPRRKVGGDHPKPTGRVRLTGGPRPGVGRGVEQLRVDPRPPGRPGEQGRGPLPGRLGRFEGIDTRQGVAELHYRVDGTLIREVWRMSEGSPRLLQRHLWVEARTHPVVLSLGRVAGAAWTWEPDALQATAGGVTLRIRGQAVDVERVEDELVLALTPASEASVVVIEWDLGIQTDEVTPHSRPAVPGRRWPQGVMAPVRLGHLDQNGLVLDVISVPENNPWRRRVRPADLAFVGPDRAAVVTYDGDVWWVDGVGAEAPAELRWSRYASGLHESLAVTAPGGVVQVATKNGILRLHDRDGDGEADWYENFNDQVIQSQSTRAFPLDMAMGPDGATYVTQGGIVNGSGIKSGGEGTVHSGAVVRIAPDGRSAATFVTGAREPFVTVHPVTGMVTGTDQQGHFTPSSVAYLFRAGDHFGFPEVNPGRLTPPLVWIPHEQDSSSTSQVWMTGKGLRPWNDRLLHLSYGTGSLFVISPDLDAPVAQGAVIPLAFKTDLPLLHAREHPSGDAVFLAGFQIWGTRTLVPWSLGRLRAGSSPATTAVGARSIRPGVVIEFATPVDPASLRPESVSARAWDYRRSAAYGSGRYTKDGTAGTTAWPVGQIVPSRDGRSVFVHLPDLPPFMQLEVRHDFLSTAGFALRGVVYFTVHQPRDLALAALGFGEIDLARSVPRVNVIQEELASVAMGKALADSLGCSACHSADGTTEGKVGPTWKGLFGSKRTFVDGTTEIADDYYLRAKILDPMRKRVSATPAEMPSYRGVVSDQQLEALVLYLRSLRAPGRPASDDR